MGVELIHHQDVLLALRVLNVNESFDGALPVDQGSLVGSANPPLVGPRLVIDLADRATRPLTSSGLPRQSPWPNLSIGRLTSLAVALVGHLPTIKPFRARRLHWCMPPDPTGCGN